MGTIGLWMNKQAETHTERERERERESDGYTNFFRLIVFSLIKDIPTERPNGFSEARTRNLQESHNLSVELL